MAKKQKFDLGHLVHTGSLKNGEKVYFVVDPSKAGSVVKAPNGEYKLDFDGDTISVHAAAQKFLGQEPPTHGANWLRNDGGKTLFELWQATLSED
jgi:hypothetical protein